MTDLPTYREAIDALDDQILEAIVARVALAKQIGAIKRDAALPMFQPDRETEVLARLRKQANGALSSEHIDTIFRAIMSACLDVE